MKKRKGGSKSPSGKGKSKSLMKKMGAGLLAGLSGIANSLFGGGGGMLVVPALRYCRDLEEKQAHATAIAVTLPLSLASATSFAVRGVYDVAMGATVACGAVVGGAIGARLLKRVSKELLSVLFYGVMIHAGVRFLR